MSATQPTLASTSTLRQSAVSRNHLPRVLEFSFKCQNQHLRSLEDIFTTILTYCDELGGVEALLPTLTTDPTTNETLNKYRIVFLKPAHAERLVSRPYHSTFVQNPQQNPPVPLRLNGHLVGTLRWSTDAFHTTPVDLEFALETIPGLKRSWYPVAIPEPGSSEVKYLDLSEQSPLRGLILTWYGRLLETKYPAPHNNSFYHPLPRFKQDKNGNHYVVFADLAASNEVLKMFQEVVEGKGTFRWRTNRQCSEEVQMTPAGGVSFTQSMWGTARSALAGSSNQGWDAFQRR